jgi:hypothetical protein
MKPGIRFYLLQTAELRKLGDCRALTSSLTPALSQRQRELGTLTPRHLLNDSYEIRETEVLPSNSAATASR